MKGGAYSRSRSLKQEVWGTASPRSYRVTLFLKSKNYVNHEICTTHSHIIVTTSAVKYRADQWYIDYWVGVWWVEPIIRYRLLHVLVQKLYLIMELVHMLRNILTLGGIRGSKTTLTLLYPLLVNKNGKI